MATRKVAKAAKVGRLEFDAALTDDQRREMEKAFHADAYGVTRRLALVLLTRSKEQILGGLRASDEACEAFTNELERLDDYIVHLGAIRETMMAAQARLVVALKTVSSERTAAA